MTIKARNPAGTMAFAGVAQPGSASDL
jgi:hypothetical protein